MNRLGEGVNRFGLIGSSVIVARLVGGNVNVGSGVFVTTGVPVPGWSVVVGGNVLSTKRSGVNVGSREYGVAVGLGVLIWVGVCKNGIDTGNPEHPESIEINKRIKTIFFMKPLR